MTAVLLGWDPVRSEAWQPDYQAAAAGASDAGFFRVVWDVSASAENLEPGSDAWFAVPGERAGIAGHGVVVSAPYGAAGPEGDPGLVLVDLDIDVLLPAGEQLLLTFLPPELAVAWPEGGGALVLDRSTEEDLRHAWARNIRCALSAAPGLLPGSLPQLALRWSLTNRWESDPDAARICFAHHGPACSACGFDAEAVFGTEGGAVMQVHHIVPSRLVGDGYELDPVTDLVPLCANCHAMAHSGFPDSYTPAELRSMLAARGGQPRAAELHGVLPSPEQLRAQADARALLGFSDQGTADQQHAD